MENESSAPPRNARDDYFRMNQEIMEKLSSGAMTRDDYFEMEKNLEELSSQMKTDGVFHMTRDTLEKLDTSSLNTFQEFLDRANELMHISEYYKPSIATEIFKKVKELLDSVILMRGSSNPVEEFNLRYHTMIKTGFDERELILPSIINDLAAHMDENDALKDYWLGSMARNTLSSDDKDITEIVSSMMIFNSEFPANPLLEISYAKAIAYVCSFTYEERAKSYLEEALEIFDRHKELIISQNDKSLIYYARAVLLSRCPQRRDDMLKILQRAVSLPTYDIRRYSIEWYIRLILKMCAEEEYGKGVSDVNATRKILNQSQHTAREIGDINYIENYGINYSDDEDEYVSCWYDHEAHQRLSEDQLTNPLPILFQFS